MRKAALFLALCFSATASFSEEKTDINEYKKLLEQAKQMQGQPGGSNQFEVLMRRLSGDVKIKPSGSEEYKPVEGTSYHPVDSDDILKTGSTGSAELYFDNAGLIKVDRNTEIEIRTLDQQDVRLNLVIGAIIGKFEKAVKKRFSMSIYAPSAVCAIRGTEFAVDHSFFGKETTFGVFDEGQIGVTPNQEEGGQGGAPEILIDKGNELTLSPATKRVKVIKLSRLTKHRSAIAAIRKNLATFRKKWQRLSPERREKLRNALLRGKAASGGGTPKAKVKKAVKKKATGKKRSKAVAEE